MESERKRTRSQVSPSTPADELNYLPRSEQEKRARFEGESLENPLAVENDEGDSNSSRSEVMNCVQNEEAKTVPVQADEWKTAEITIIQSGGGDDDDDYDDNVGAAAAVTEQKGVSRRVKKKLAPAPAPEGLKPRRVSPRLQGLPEDQRPCYFPSPRIQKSKLDNGGVVSSEDSDAAVQSDVALEDSTSAGSNGVQVLVGVTAEDVQNPGCSVSPVKSRNVGGKRPNNGEEGKKNKRKKQGMVGNKTVLNSAVAEGPETDGHCGSQDFEGLAGSATMNAESRVKDTLRIFNGYFLHYAKEEENRCKKEVGERKEKSKTSKRSRVKVANKGENTEKSKATSKRPDLKAATKMKDTNAILYPKKRFGHLPGVNVGDHFFSRCELVALGLHNHWLGGIDCMGSEYGKMEQYKDYPLPLAVSVVLSGKYEDDVDNSVDVIYTGQGGNNILGNKRQIKDQTMSHGNLALKNSMDQGTPVRVIRGHKSVHSYTRRVYTYDGLYKVIDHWVEKGLSGFTVYKFRLRRIEGQPELTTDQVHFHRAQIPNSLSELRGLVCRDISNGLEKIPIPASNVVDDSPLVPQGYTYLNTIKVANGVEIPSPAKGCTCKGNCVDEKKCSCARLNGNGFPYVNINGGRLVCAKSVVYECGPHCGCGPSCVNRTSQQGLKYKLEVYRTANKGWAVRSWESIPSGALVCEYTGILMRTDELDNVSENNFIFEIDCLQTMKGIDGRERRLGDVSNHADIQLGKIDDKKDGQPEFCIDAGTAGGVARFINHSCEPNLFVQCVLSSHHDARLARVMLVAADNIQPLQELTYDYGYALDSVIDEHGKIKQMPCYCGAIGCRKRLY